MAVAGKVAITLSTENGGAWSADVTYDRLVAVKHNNNLYISRKTVSNVEPPNDEFWFLALEGFGGDDVQALIDRLNELSDLIQEIIDGTTQVGNAKTLDGHGAEYFAQRAKINGAKYGDGNDITVYSPSETPRNFGGINSTGWYRIAQTSGALGTNFNVSILLSKMFNSTNAEDYYITLAYAHSNPVFTQLNSSVNEQNIKKIRFVWKYQNISYIDIYYTGPENAVFAKLLSSIHDNAFVNVPFTAVSETVEEGYGVTEFELSSSSMKTASIEVSTVNGGTPLHTGNKPTGSYTGNGEQRTINVGGIGDFLVITSVYGTAFVTSSGGIMADASTITPFGSDAANTFNGYLSLNSGDVRLNASGVAYKYEVH